ncbi:MAG TPA: imidazoleglycerol-phosphate dehydratase HisB [Solirubrobacteraceae bacterium]|nr:imidazoleglycerol-phosphate dehydratase HisB [Solirubrobacteraceae bacterium]
MSERYVPLRHAEIERRTGETHVRLALALEGSGAGERRSGVGFFDHMLDLLADHARIDLSVQAEGDLERGAHHTVEDCGIALGQALGQALGERRGIRRFGFACVPMDEARASVAIDISGRPYARFEGALPPGSIGNFEVELAEEFMRAFAGAARLTLHVRIEAGSNAHHMIEAAFKALALALRDAVEADMRRSGVPSTKGTLTA